VVMTHEEVIKVISFMKGVPQLAGKLLYGCGLRITEAIRLRVHDIEFDRYKVGFYVILPIWPKR